MRVLMFDLDGTLLNEEHTISEYTKTVLCKVHNAGIKLGIATGRPIHTVEKKIQQWGLEGIITMVVGMNGSHIKDLETGYYKELSLMPSEGVDALFSLYEDLPCEMSLSDEENVYMKDYSFFCDWICTNDYLHYVQTDFVEERKKDWPKLCIISTPDLLPMMVERLQQFKRTDMVGNIASPYSLEFTHADINKGVSIRKLCAGLDVAMSDVMAFGDANNDLKMLEAVGYPVAMKNASDEVKALAKEITKYDNTQDGVAKYLEENLDWIIGGL